MKRLSIFAAVLFAAAASWAQEGFPPGSIPVPGTPGAMSHPDVPAGYVLIEGDIQVRLADYQAYLSGADATFGGGATFWGSTVPFAFNANVTATNQQNAINAMNAISARVGITFVPRSSQSNWITFNDSNGNNSPVGMQGGSQTINIFNWGTQIVICHEIYHTLGFWHEQSRPDRDTYITINSSNIQSGAEHNFDIHSGAGTYGWYDFDSFMHYDKCSFSNGCPPGSTCSCPAGTETITVNQPWTAQWQNAIGQRNHFSYFDAIACRGLYPFFNDRWWQAGAGGNGSGNLLNPLTHSTFGGAYNAAPAGGTLFIKQGGSFSAIGTYTKAMTIQAPLGATLGN